MKTPWEPPLASQPLETLMEKRDVPEEDRDEIRKFTSFLESWTKRPKNPEDPLIVTKEQLDWVTGKDLTNE